MNFKTCSMCGFAWKDQVSFLNDANVLIIGYQACFANPKRGLFFFNHSCHGTFTLAVHVFENLYDGPMFQNKLTGTDECPGYCLYKKKLGPCPAKCECAYVREIIQIIKSFK